MVREGGLEPPRGCPHKVLSLARLPFRHSREQAIESFIRLTNPIQATCAVSLKSVDIEPSAVRCRGTQEISADDFVGLLHSGTGCTIGNANKCVTIPKRGGEAGKIL
jgi:hypothetical protein